MGLQGGGSGSFLSVAVCEALSLSDVGPRGEVHARCPPPPRVLVGVLRGETDGEVGVLCKGVRAPLPVGQTLSNWNLQTRRRLR